MLGHATRLAEAFATAMRGIEEVSTAALLNGAARDERAAGEVETAAGAAELGTATVAAPQQS